MRCDNIRTSPTPAGLRLVFAGDKHVGIINELSIADGEDAAVGIQRQHIAKAARHGEMVAKYASWRCSCGYIQPHATREESLTCLPERLSSRHVRHITFPPPKP